MIEAVTTRALPVLVERRVRRQLFIDKSALNSRRRLFFTAFSTDQSLPRASSGVRGLKAHGTMTREFANFQSRSGLLPSRWLRGARRRYCVAYCRAMAMRMTSSAETMRSALLAASAMASCTPLTHPVKALPRAP